MWRRQGLPNAYERCNTQVKMVFRNDYLTFFIMDIYKSSLVIPNTAMYVNPNTNNINNQIHTLVGIRQLITAVGTIEIAVAKRYFFIPPVQNEFLIKSYSLKNKTRAIERLEIANAINVP